MSVRALRAALERMAALLVACVARHTALLTPCPAPQTNPHHPHTHMKTALSNMRGITSRQARPYQEVIPRTFLSVNPLTAATL